MVFEPFSLLMMTLVHIKAGINMSFLLSYWSVENINRLRFTRNESKVMKPDKINLELVYLI